MAGHKRFLWVALATALIAPSKARARARSYVAASPDGPPQKQTRRPSTRVAQTLAPIASPGGRHVVEVRDGGVFVDGKRIHPSDGTVYVLGAPTFRSDGGAVAWLERNGGETRLVVVPELGRRSEPLPWTLPALRADAQIFWAGVNRVVVGPELLAPIAVASWTD
jgi:hypothetical protein